MRHGEMKTLLQDWQAALNALGSDALDRIGERCAVFAKLMDPAVGQLLPNGLVAITQAACEDLVKLGQYKAVADAAREALRHMERHGVTIAGKKLREALEKLDA
jgi:membrane protein required for beta-lactamase induction